MSPYRSSFPPVVEKKPFLCRMGLHKEVHDDMTDGYLLSKNYYHCCECNAKWVVYYSFNGQYALVKHKDYLTEEQYYAHRT